MSYSWQPQQLIKLLFIPHRLWYRPRCSDDGPGPTQIGVFNVVPATVKKGSVIHAPTFASLNDTMASVNRMFTSNPLPGNHAHVVERVLMSTCLLFRLRSAASAPPPPVRSSVWWCWGMRSLEVPISEG